MNKYKILILEYLDPEDKEWNTVIKEVSIIRPHIKKFVKQFLSKNRKFIQSSYFEITKESNYNNYEKEGSIVSYTWNKHINKENKHILDTFVDGIWNIVTTILPKKGWKHIKDEWGGDHIHKKIGKTDFVLSRYTGDNDGNGLGISDRRELSGL